MKYKPSCARGLKKYVKQNAETQKFKTYFGHETNIEEFKKRKIRKKYDHEISR